MLDVAASWLLRHMGRGGTPPSHHSAGRSDAPEPGSAAGDDEDITRSRADGAEHLRRLLLPGFAFVAKPDVLPAAELLVLRCGRTFFRWDGPRHWIDFAVAPQQPETTCAVTGADWSAHFGYAELGRSLLGERFSSLLPSTPPPTRRDHPVEQYTRISVVLRPSLRKGSERWPVPGRVPTSRLGPADAAHGVAVLGRRVDCDGGAHPRRRGLRSRPVRLFQRQHRAVFDRPPHAFAAVGRPMCRRCGVEHQFPTKPSGGLGGVCVCVT